MKRLKRSHLIKTHIKNGYFLKNKKRKGNYFFKKSIILVLKYPTPTRHIKRITPIMAMEGVLVLLPLEPGFSVVIS